MVAGSHVNVITSDTAMIRLTADLYPNVAALYDESGLCFPLIRAVIDRLQRGSIWADDPDRPEVALVVTAFGFTLLLGAESRASDERLRAMLVTPAGELPGYLLWYAPPPGWRAWLDARPEGSLRSRERVRLRWDGVEPGPSDTGAEGVQLASLDAALIPEVDKLGLRLGSRFWSSAEDFLAHGFGTCLVGDDGAVVSVCYASCVADNLAEIDIATREDRRGRGCAGIVAREFVRQCRQRRLLPTWDCFTANQASLRLALSLGFVEAYRYPLYSFSPPLPS